MTCMRLAFVNLHKSPPPPPTYNIVISLSKQILGPQVCNLCDFTRLSSCTATCIDDLYMVISLFYQHYPFQKVTKDLILFLVKSRVEADGCIGDTPCSPEGFRLSGLQRDSGCQGYRGIQVVRVTGGFRLSGLHPNCPIFCPVQV